MTAAIANERGDNFLRTVGERLKSPAALRKSFSFNRLPRTSCGRAEVKVCCCLWSETVKTKRKSKQPSLTEDCVSANLDKNPPALPTTGHCRLDVKGFLQEVKLHVTFLEHCDVQSTFPGILLRVTGDTERCN